MKKNVVKFLSALVLSVFVTSPLLAEDAVVTYVKGKVEVQKGDSWVALKVGDTIKQSDTVSTGFQSEAKIKYSGSLMALGALTRITMDQLASGGNKEKVDVYLSTGAVRSKVTHSEDTHVNYTVRSSVAVASVRGTDFQMTDKGSVTCFEGAVAVFPNTQKRGEAADEAASEEGEEEGEEISGVAEGENGPAGPTTDPDDIAPEAEDKNAVVVGANQKTTFTKTGAPEKPQDTAKKDANKVKSTVQTAATKEAEVTGGTTTSETPAEAPAAPKTGKLVIDVTFEE